MHKNLKTILDAQLKDKSNDKALLSHPDPLWVARELKEPTSALICALFGYGNAAQIVKFLRSLDFELLDQSETEIRKNLKNHKYRFQNPNDVAEIFITLSRLKKDSDIEQIIKENLCKNGQIQDGIYALINKIYQLNSYKSSGYEFFFGQQGGSKSPLKRYNMYLRWMVRDLDIDLGIFKSIDKSDLLLPLDVHTHRVSMALGLSKRKSYDLKSVIEITQNLKKFDPQDPIKYDFALYRIGQAKELEKILAQLNQLS